MCIIYTKRVATFFLTNHVCRYIVIKNASLLIDKTCCVSKILSQPDVQHFGSVSNGRESSRRERSLNWFGYGEELTLAINELDKLISIVNN